MTILPRLALVRNTRRFLLTMAVMLAPALLLPFSSRAQSAKQVAEIMRTLSPESQKVIALLSSLDSLPAEQWRYHSGDLAHGEAPSLDDSSWPLMKPDSAAPTEAVWYRRVVEVPKTLNGYDLTGARIWFHSRPTPTALCREIIYFNGRRVAWATTWSRSFCSIRPSPATRYWSRSSCCIPWTRKPSAAPH